jgi:hypothetical protein
MSTKVQIRRGSTSSANAFTGAEGELYVDLGEKSLRVHDGVQQGGFLLAKESELETKQNSLVSGTNIKTINGSSILGSGNLTLVTDISSKVDKINITAGTVGSGSAIPIITYNAQGQITSVSTSALNIPANIATETYVNNQISSLVNAAPSALNTLNELASALGNDASFATTVTNSLAGKQATLVSGTNIKTINNSSILGSGNISVQAALVSGTNIKTVGGSSILGGGDLSLNISSLADAYASGTTLYVGAKNNSISATGTLIVDTIGRGSLTSSANQNVMLGYASGYATSSGTGNTYVGALAAYSSTTAQNNVAVGRTAGYALTTAENNSLFGAYAGFNLNTGVDNTFIGANAGRDFTTGNNNIVIGSNVGRNNLDGLNNTFIAGGTLGNRNTIIGRYSTGDTLNNNVIIADGAGTIRFRSDSAGNITINGNITAATFTGLVKLQQSSELIATKSNASSTVEHNFSESSIWYHTSISSNFTPNFTNVPTDTNWNNIVTLVLSQGATPYIPSSIQINGSSQTVKWLNGEVPIGNSNSIDVISFSLMRVSSGWIVLGSLTRFA